METKTYQLVLSPDLNLSSSEVVTAWNADAQASTIASIHLAPSEAKQFDPSLIITLVSTVGFGLLTNAIYDVLKAAAIK